MLLAASPPTKPREPSLSPRVAATIMAVYPNGRGDSWNYEEATMLEGMDQLWTSSSNEVYLHYIQHCADRFVAEDGSIRTYRPDELSLDDVLMGRQLLFLHRVTGLAKYRKAADAIYAQLQRQPRTPEGGFWHKQRYPQQMWLDGLYMAEPFYAEYSVESHHRENLADVTRQFKLLEQHTRDPKTGLLYHGWDASRQQHWANPRTGASASLWSRAMGWYAMALVDTLDYIPADDPGHSVMVGMLNRFAKAIVAAQDGKGLWFQIADRAGVAGNYEESSASAMFVYALLKGVRKAWLAPTYRAAATRGFRGIVNCFVTTDQHGGLHFEGTADAVGLGGSPYRDGSFAYYTSVPQVRDDGRGLGALLLAANQMELAEAGGRLAK